MFTTDQEEARKNVIQSLEDVEKAGVAYLNAMMIQLFSQCKKDEIVEMMKVATPQQRQRVFQIMVKIDPANTQRYKEMGV